MNFFTRFTREKTPQKTFLVKKFHKRNFICVFFQERENVESLFSLDYTHNYFQGHETRYLSQLVAIIKAKDPDQGPNHLLL